MDKEKQCEEALRRLLEYDLRPIVRKSCIFNAKRAVFGFEVAKEWFDTTSQITPVGWIPITDFEFENDGYYTCIVKNGLGRRYLKEFYLREGINGGDVVVNGDWDNKLESGEVILYYIRNVEDILPC